MKNLKIVNQIEFLKFKTVDDYEINISDKNILMREDELIEYNLNREYDIDKLNQIFKDAQDDKKVLKYCTLPSSSKVKEYMRDMYLGIALHSQFHISRSEASRFEFWNTIIFQVPEAKKYLAKRGDRDIQEAIKHYTVLNPTNLIVTNVISAPWWVVEMSRNGDDYELSKVAFEQTTTFYSRWFNSTALHNQILTIAYLTYLHKKDWKNCLDGKSGKEYDRMRSYVDDNTEKGIRRQISINLQKVLNDHISTNEYLNNIVNLDIGQNDKNYAEWLNSSKKTGPKDFKVGDKIINTLEKEFDLVLDIYMKNPNFSSEIDEE